GSAPPAVARDPEALSHREALSHPDPAPVPAPAPAAPAPPAGAPGGRPPGARAAARRSAHKAARRAARRRHLTAGVLTVGGLVVLPLVLWSVAGDGNPSGAGRGAEEAPGPDATERTRDPSWAGAGDAGNGALRGRLHNVGSGLCVGIEGDRAVEDAEAELVPCSTDTTQQWTYETDGLLRSGAAPELCLDSRLGYSVRLAPCTGAAQPDSRNVRYDFTRQGALVPRWDQDLALAPAATDGSGALVVKARADQDAQRWVVDASKADLRMEAVTWDVALPSPRPAPTRTAAPTPAGTTAPPPSPSASPASPAPSGTASGPPSCDRYGHHCDEDGRYGSPGYSRPGYGYGGYGPDGYGGDGGR
ncbi:RICIN domain-containing protein, partial [Streptomyces sp. NPDC057794]|uniref:RICIN domain-containing protein n=1 Tax=Streptomyces sp. NPDC057794 TaxID=3346251 RepID=UPI0036A87A7E